MLLLPAPGAGPAAAPRARPQLCKHEGAVSTGSLVSQCPHPQCPQCSVTVSPSSPPIASLSCQAARWGRCGPAAPEYLLSKLPPLQYLDISQNNFYVYVNNIYFCLVFTTEPPALSPVPAPASPVACRSCPSLLPPAASAARSSSSSCGAESVTPPATWGLSPGPGVEQCWADNTLHSVTRDTCDRHLETRCQKIVIITQSGNQLLDHN